MESAMRLVTDLVFALAFRRFWRRRLADQYAILLADIGLTQNEQQAFLVLRRAR
jgi:hypothetical protein